MKIPETDCPELPRAEAGGVPDWHSLPPPPFERVAAVIDSNPSATRRGAALIRVGLGALCALAAAAVFLAYGGFRDGGSPRPAYLIIGTTVGSALIAAGAVWLLRSPRRSMFGRSDVVLLAGAALVPVALLVWKVALSASVPDMMARWPERIGIPCLQISLLAGLGPLLALLWYRRGAEPVNAGRVGLLAGVAAGGIAWVVTDLWCPVGHIPHLLFGHVLPLALLGVAGGLIGRRWLRLRWRAPGRD